MRSRTTAACARRRSGTGVATKAARTTASASSLTDAARNVREERIGGLAAGVFEEEHAHLLEERRLGVDEARGGDEGGAAGGDEVLADRRAGGAEGDVGLAEGPFDRRRGDGAVGDVGADGVGD